MYRLSSQIESLEKTVGTLERDLVETRKQVNKSKPVKSAKEEVPTHLSIFHGLSANHVEISVKFMNLFSFALEHCFERPT